MTIFAVKAGATVSLCAAAAPFAGSFLRPFDNGLQKNVGNRVIHLPAGRRIGRSPNGKLDYDAWRVSNSPRLEEFVENVRKYVEKNVKFIKRKLIEFIFPGIALKLEYFNACMHFAVVTEFHVDVGLIMNN